MDLAACRSALIRNKIVMRFGCCLVAMSMIMSCWATPKAKAVATETALLGSIFGSLLVSMGYSWAADNMDVPGFGEALYKLTQEYDESNKDTGFQLIRDLNLAGVVSVGAGKLQFAQAWVNAARSFAEWFQGKFFTGNDNFATVYEEGGFSFSLENPLGWGTLNYPYNFSSKTTASGSNPFLISFGGYQITEPGTYTFSVNRSFTVGDGEMYLDRVEFHNIRDTLIYDDSGNYRYADTTLSSDSVSWTITSSMISSGITMSVRIVHNDKRLDKNYVYPISSYTTLSFSGAKVTSLTAEKPQEVHYPDVAEDGSQVYEITVDGVTVTDIEGIIQGAVDRILAGTAAIAGEVAQAQDVPAEPDAPPELDGLDLPALGAALTTRFPFSIPWDVARGIQMLAAPAEAPYWEVDFLAPLGYRVGGWKGSTLVVLDFSEFEIIGQVTRWMSTIGFCLMLASSTKRLIWVA